MTTSSTTASTSEPRKRKGPSALLSRCFEPAAIAPDALRVCIAIASRDEFFGDERRAALASATLTGQPKMTVEGGIATIPVSGPLVRRAGAIVDVSALTSYDTIQASLRAAMADPKVRALHWIIDSPGGEVSGLFELADEIMAARSIKPMAASVIKADSAAYVIAAAAGDIAIEQAGEAGSIGAIIAVPPADDSKTIRFVSSVSPLKASDPKTSTGGALVQTRADQLGAMIVSKVAALRGVTAAKVAADFGKGDVLLGIRAKVAGLADRVESIPATRARLAAKIAATPARAPGPAAPVPRLSPLPPVAAAVAVDSQVAAIDRLIDRAADEARRICDRNARSSTTAGTTPTRGNRR